MNKKANGLAALLVIALIGVIVYAYLKVFIWKNADWIDFLLVTAITGFLTLAFISIFIDSLIEHFSKSKILKLVKKYWEKISDLISSGLSGL